VEDEVGDAEGEERDQRHCDQPPAEIDRGGGEHDRRRQEEAADVADEVLAVVGQRRDPAAAEREVVVERARRQQRIEPVDRLDRGQRPEAGPEDQLP